MLRGWSGETGNEIVHDNGVAEKEEKQPENSEAVPFLAETPKLHQAQTIVEGPSVVLRGAG